LGTQDVNAAVEGAVAAGATDILVNDGHGRWRRNLLYAELHPAAKLLKARPTTEGFTMAGFDAGFDAVFFVGWHARPLSPGVLSHCFNDLFLAWRVNGTPVGEAELSAALAGHQGVPLALFTGDDRSCDQVKAWCPQCECVTTKHAVDRFSAICLPHTVTLDAIRQGAERALNGLEEIAPFCFGTPVRVEADVLFDHAASAIALIPGVERTADLTVAFETGDYVEAFRAVHAMAQMARNAE
jgi:D-amino peptidase